MTSYESDLAVALELADAVSDYTLDAFRGRTRLAVRAKPDDTPVTEADVATEETIRRLLGERRPDDALLGEELGGEPELAGRQWVIDPIDGTKNFVRGVPVWATLIALVDAGEPVVGIVSAPALHRRWYAARGAGAFLTEEDADPVRIGVSKVGKIEDASIAISSLSGWRERNLRDRLVELTDRAWRLRGYGDFFNYCLLAEGAVDVAAEPEVSLWDLAAPAAVVAEAGGTFTDLDGNPGPAGGSAVATNGPLHEEVLEALTGDWRNYIVSPSR